MRDQLNLLISATALALSIASALYTWFEHRKLSRLRIRDEVVEALAAFDRYETTFMAMSRERDKTGDSKTPAEQSLFDKLETACREFQLLSGDLRILLTRNTIRFDERAMAELRSVAQMADSLSAKHQVFFDRFRRFNDNRLPEMRDKLESLRQTIASLGG